MIRGSDSSDGILTFTRPTFTAKNNWEGWIKYEPPPPKNICWKTLGSYQGLRNQDPWRREIKR